MGEGVITVWKTFHSTVNDDVVDAQVKVKDAIKKGQVVVIDQKQVTPSL